LRNKVAAATIDSNIPDHLKKAQIEQITEEDFLKAEINLTKLVQKIVQVHGPHGVYNAIRWIDPSTGHSVAIGKESPDVVGFKGDPSTKLKAIVEDDGLSKAQKIRDLVGMGIYDKKILMNLTQTAYAQIHSEFKNLNITEGTGPVDVEVTPETSGENMPVNDGKEGMPDVSGLSEKQYKRIIEQQRAKNRIDSGLTYKDFWNSYESTLKGVILDGYPKSLIAYGTGGLGKASPLNTDIITSSGVIKMKDVRVGMKILTPSGRQSKVVKIFPQGKKEIFTITLSDGTKAQACAEHLWKVWDKTGYWDKAKKERVRGGRYSIMTTQQLIDKGIKSREKSTSSNDIEIPAEWRFLIPFLPVPVQFNEQPLVIDPYALGYLIGDGSLTTRSLSVSIGKQDQENSIDNLNKALSSINVSIKSQRRDKRVVDFGFENNTVLLEDLSKSDLAGCNSYTKFIPKKYLFNSIQNRLALLQGLMDTDGTCGGKRGFCVYYTVSEQLAKDVQQLALSFGRQASVKKQKRQYSGLAKTHREKNGIFNSMSEIYEVHFAMPEGFNPFRLKRKADKWANRIGRPDIRGKAIVSIESTSFEEAQCIMIDDPEHLYITNDFITTHNTYTLDTVMEQLQVRKFDSEINPTSEQYDAIVIKGGTGIRDMWQIICDNKDKLIVFDDCDSMWKGGDDNPAQNILKGMLDTSGDGSVRYGNAGKDQDGNQLPKQIKFTGQVVFISNLQREDFPQPLISSRCGAIDLTMTKDETLDKLNDIKGSIKVRGKNDVLVEISQESRNAAYEFFKKFKNQLDLGQINGRTFAQVAQIHNRLEKEGAEEDRFEKEAQIRMNLV